MNDSDFQYMRLAAVPEVGAKMAARLLEKFGSVENIFSASKSELMQIERMRQKCADSILASANLIGKTYLERMAKLKIEYVGVENEKYPQSLRPFDSMPLGLYVRGNADTLNMPCIAIVGTRFCSVYGQMCARAFARDFAEAGFCVVSGMARGIDSYAHMGALEANGKTIAVLGNGVDIVYPPENSKLYEDISQKGVVVSEFKLGQRADRASFPMRNRIVAGLSLAVVVIESGLKGGSMITASIAAEQGKDVFAVPGRIDSESSAGCHALIKDGALLATSARDVIEQLRFCGRTAMPKNVCAVQGELNLPTPKISELNLDSLGGDEKFVFEFFKDGAKLSANEISLKCEMPPAKIAVCLSMLEIKKFLKRTIGDKYERM